jgi:MFS family permease
MSARREPLLSFRFLELCLFNFAASAAVFALLPVVPFRIRELGGGTEAAGLFLGALTFASAVSAPWTGAIGDALGQGRVLGVTATGLALLFGCFGFVDSWPLLVALAALQGILWSGLLTSSGAYAVRLIPESRRAEGFAVHGMATILAITVAPTLGFLLFATGWRWLTVALAATNAAIALLSLRFVRAESRPSELRAALAGEHIAWPVLRFAFGIFLVSFGYGGVTSFVALFCESRGIAPKGLFFAAFAGTIFVLRPFVGRWVDRVGAFRTFAPSIVILCAGLAILPLATTRAGVVAAAFLYGLGFSSVGPAFTAYVISRMPANRRGSAFGANLAAFDSGIGTGSTSFGPIVARAGYGAAFGTAAALSLLALPWFFWMRDRFERATAQIEVSPS